VIDKVTGMLVKPMRPELLSEAILQVIKNPELMKKYGKAGRERVITEYGYSIDSTCYNI
jgi:glycosyltransferase involved in cell wall biosynthesis